MHCHRDGVVVLCVTHHSRGHHGGRYACNIKQWRNVALFCAGRGHDDCGRERAAATMLTWCHTLAALWEWLVGMAPVPWLPGCSTLIIQPLLEGSAALLLCGCMQSVLSVKAAARVKHVSASCFLQTHFAFLKAVICVRSGRLRPDLQWGCKWHSLYFFVCRTNSVKLIYSGVKLMGNWF